MKLALVNPPYYAKPFNEDLSAVDDEFGVFPPLAFGWVAREAKAVDWQVRLWDVYASRQDDKEVGNEIISWGADLLALAVPACQTADDNISWAKKIKAHTGLPILVGGYEAKVYPAEILSHGCFDFLCTTEAVGFIPRFLEAFSKGHGYDRVPGLVYRKNGGFHYTFTGPSVNFNEFPTPDRNIFPNEQYYSHISQRRNFTVGVSQIGCPYPCDFCCMRLSGFQSRSAEQVVDEMEESLQVGVREFDWMDPIMLYDRERSLDIAREIKRRKLNMIWSCRSRIDSLSFHDFKRKPDVELIETLADSGCRRIFFGVESGDDETLKLMSKGQSVSGGHINRTLSCVREAGIMTLGFFMLGGPGDSKAKVKTTISLALKLPLDYAEFQIAIIKPHSKWEQEYMIEATGIDYWREYIRGSIGEYILPNPWTSLSRPELESLARRAYLRFYSRPKYIFQMLSRIESRDEFMRYVKVAFQLFLRPITSEQYRSSLHRAYKALMIFLGALFAIVRPGARHEVTALGGNLAAAFRLAAKELRKKKEGEVLAPELARKLVEGFGNETLSIDGVSETKLTGRYSPHNDVGQE